MTTTLNVGVIPRRTMTALSFIIRSTGGNYIDPPRRRHRLRHPHRARSAMRDMDTGPCRDPGSSAARGPGLLADRRQSRARWQAVPGRKENRLPARMLRRLLAVRAPDI